MGNSNSGRRKANPQLVGDELVSAAVDLAGAVSIETGHVANYTAQHVQVRIGPVLVYLLDWAAAESLHRAAAAAAASRHVFAHGHTGRLPRDLQATGQEISLVVRLRGAQSTPAAVVGSGHPSRPARAVVACTVGRLRVVCHDAEALHRLVRVATSALRVAGALWGGPTPDELEEQDEFAAQWEAEQANR